MTDVFQLILATYVLTLILPPVTYSCENAKTFGFIGDYRHVIHPLLQHIENILAKDLQNKTCPTSTPGEMCEENNERSYILKMVSSIPFRNPERKSQIKCELRKLASLIETSLECNIKSHSSQEDCSLLRPRPLGKRMLCIVNQVIDGIHSCYRKVAEKNS
ncbi:hypothetical protein GN956_G14098 [Arapaima gigas]